MSNTFLEGRLYTKVHTAAAFYTRKESPIAPQPLHFLFILNSPPHTQDLALRNFLPCSQDMKTKYLVARLGHKERQKYVICCCVQHDEVNRNPPANKLDFIFGEQGHESDCDNLRF